MRKFNFNAFKKEDPADKLPEAPKRKYSAYRTIISRHEAASARLKDEPIAIINTD
ncbi:MAG: hypothetical protein IKB86_02695 [Clostridia bacterium]|nr:hypothetical protein [Clostridia bacterium]